MLFKHRGIIKWCAALAVLLLLLVTAGCGSAKTVATVNGEKITRAKLDTYINILRFLYPQLDDMLSDKSRVAMLEKDILETLVENILIRQAVAQKGLTVTQEDIDNTYKGTRGQIMMMMFTSEEEFAARLKELKITENDLKELVASGTYAEKLYESFLAEVKDEELKEFLAENPSYAQAAAVIEPSHILVKTKEEALAVRERLQAGEDFSELAKEVSTEPAAKTSGGYLDKIPLDAPNWDKDFMTAAAELEVGEISMPVESQFGWHIITLHSRSEARELTFEEVRDAAADALVSEQMNVFYTQLREQADVKSKL